MTAVIGHVLPLALAVALSSIPIIATILILLSPAKPRVGLGFLVGLTVGIVIVVSVLSVGFRLLPSSTSTSHDVPAGIVEILLGVALVVFSLIQWRRGIRKQPKTELPSWMNALSKLKWWQALGVGFALALRPKNVLLSLAAGVEIGGASLAFDDAAIVIGIFTIIGVSTVAVPIVSHLVAAEKMNRPLVEVRRWILKNSQTMMFIVLLMTGVVVVGAGLSRL